MMNTTPTTQPPELTTTEITGALHAILNTDKFMASPQMSAFLRYVVEQTLIGNTRRIKAFTVGIEALGKPASFDPQTDPSVRVLAKRLRSSLDTYYAQNLDTEVFIEMKPGSYVPKFLRRNEMPVEMPASSPPAHYPAQHSVNVSATPVAAVASENASAPHTQNTDVAQADLANAQPLDQSAGSAAHLSVQQQNASSSRTEENTATAVNNTEQNDRKNSISQLWQAYKSASKVA